MVKKKKLTQSIKRKLNVPFHSFGFEKKCQFLTVFQKIILNMVQEMHSDYYTMYTVGVRLIDVSKIGAFYK